MIQFSSEYDLDNTLSSLNTEQIKKLVNRVEKDTIRHIIIGKAVLLTPFGFKQEKEKTELLYQDNQDKLTLFQMMDAKTFSLILSEVMDSLKINEPEDICRTLERRIRECKESIEEDSKITLIDSLYSFSTYLLKRRYPDPYLLKRMGRSVEERLIEYSRSDRYQEAIKEMSMLSSNGSPDAKSEIRGIKAIRLLVDEENIIRGVLSDELRATN